MKPEEAIKILGETTLCTPLGQAAFVGVEAIKRVTYLQSKIDSGELVKVVHSHKIPIMRETAVFDWKCENCDMPMCDDDLYCPNCGAKMDSK